MEWNYSQSGHGKRAPDGNGGCLEGTANKLVAQDKDIPDMQTLVNNLKENVKNVFIELVEECYMLEKEMLIPHNLPDFQGTLSVHQVLWNSDRRANLAMRKLSCAEKECVHRSSKCLHDQHITFFNIDAIDINTSQNRRKEKRKKER